MKAKQKNKQNSCYIIAEAGVNHNGSIKMAKQLIDVAAESGADAVKFQTFKAEKVISKLAPKAEYQKIATDATESQLDMVKRLELDIHAHHALIAHCQSRCIQFLSTPFDFESIDLLTKTLDLPCIKIPSGEITNGPYLLKIAQTGKQVILSTGICTLGEIETALGVLAFGYSRKKEKPSMDGFQKALGSEAGRKILEEKVILLHCTTEYPAPFDEINLRVMETMRSAFGLPIGLSDHTKGIAVSIAAVALGAVVVEKHFTLDRNLTGPDHKASLLPEELTKMISGIRQVEKSLGSALKMPTKSELKNRDIARKSLVASMPIRKGETFTEMNLTIKRPGHGMSPMLYWEVIGKPSRDDFQHDELISL